MKVLNWCVTLSLTLNLFHTTAQAQNNDTGNTTPRIDYSRPQKYTIANIAVTGMDNYEDYVLIGLSGLSQGDIVTIPGNEITAAVKNFWRHGLFSDVKILATKIQRDSVWIEIQLKQRPRIAEIRYNGVKKSEQQDLEARIGLIRGSQVTPNLIDRAKTMTKRYFDDKGFKNAEVIIVRREDSSNSNQEIVDINIDKKEKVKVNSIQIVGNQAIKTSRLKKVMKKTNEKGKLKNLFRTKKFVPENYEADKQLIIDRYNELGYRDARIVADSVTNYDNRTVDVFLEIEEGNKYYVRNITWVGNTLYPSEQLDYLLRMKRGDVYNQKLLNERLHTDDNAIGNLYYNTGYLFYNLDPVEENIVGDSIDLEMRIFEGKQATINKVSINGNDRLYENIVRRELRTRPGMLFSRDDLMRSMREIQQMGHFDPENIQPDIQPNPENGTVDIGYNLASKANDQMEFSAGWGQTGLIGKISLKLTNFSLGNLLRPSTYRGIIPQGDGQTLTLSGQTNARYYQSYGISFLDPWFGGKRPNTLMFSAHYSRMTGIEERFYNRNPYTQYYPGYYENAYDTDKSMQNFNFSLGYGKRLSWPDDYFHFMATLNYQIYKMKNWDYYMSFINNGMSHNINLELSLQRSSTDNPIFPRQGSEFLLSVSLTPPYSLFDGKDYESMDGNAPGKFRFIEYHKWKFRSKMYMSLGSPGMKKVPVLMTRVEYGLLGSYNKHKKSPFETYYVGGDMSSGGSYSYGVESIPMRGYASGSLGTNAYAYTKVGLELRYPLMLEPTTTIYVLGFVEGGNAWNDVKKMNPFDLKRSAGFGVRIMLPMIGLMGIDWTYGFDAINGSRQNSGSQLQFVLGQEF